MDRSYSHFPIPICIYKYKEYTKNGGDRSQKRRKNINRPISIQYSFTILSTSFLIVHGAHATRNTPHRVERLHKISKPRNKSCSNNRPLKEWYISFFFFFFFISIEERNRNSIQFSIPFNQPKPDLPENEIHRVIHL